MISVAGLTLARFYGEPTPDRTAWLDAAIRVQVAEEQEPSPMPPRAAWQLALFRERLSPAPHSMFVHMLDAVGQSPWGNA